MLYSNLLIFSALAVNVFYFTIEIGETEFKSGRCESVAEIQPPYCSPCCYDNYFVYEAGWPGGFKSSFRSLGCEVLKEKLV